MRTFVVVAPASVVTWEQAAQHLKLDEDSPDRTLVEGYIAAATATLDGPTGWLGRAIGVQTLEARADSFGCGSIVLRFPPLIDIVNVRYVDAAGVEQVIAQDRYELIDTSLLPAFGLDWPVPRPAREAVRVQYRAGYAPGTLPASITVAILLMVGDLYRFRETAAVGISIGAVPMSTKVEDLLESLRKFA